MDIFHAPALFLLVAAVIGYVLPLVSARVAKAHWPPEVEGLLTLVFATLTGLASELIHAATSDDGFSWRVWASTAVTSLLLAAIGLVQSWRGSNTAARLRAKGSNGRGNMHTDRTPGL
jgi:hypothetical protein